MSAIKTNRMSRRLHRHCPGGLPPWSSSWHQSLLLTMLSWMKWPTSLPWLIVGLTAAIARLSLIVRSCDVALECIMINKLQSWRRCIQQLMASLWSARGAIWFGRQEFWPAPRPSYSSTIIWSRCMALTTFWPGGSTRIPGLLHFLRKQTLHTDQGSSTPKSTNQWDACM